MDADIKTLQCAGVFIGVTDQEQAVLQVVGKTVGEWVKNTPQQSVFSTTLYQVKTRPAQRFTNLFSFGTYKDFWCFHVY